MEYNYQRFKTSNYEYAKFPGPKAGDSMLDFPMTRLDGATVNLADYKGKWVVIETGSLTCPMFVKNINPIKKLQAKYSDVVFLVVYVREAHPGSRTNPHKSIDDKLALAKQTVADYGDDRETLVDDLAGTMHRALGSFPSRRASRSTPIPWRFFTREWAITRTRCSKSSGPSHSARRT